MGERPSFLPLLLLAVVALATTVVAFVFVASLVKKRNAELKQTMAPSPLPISPYQNPFAPSISPSPSPANPFATESASYENPFGKSEDSSYQNPFEQP